MKFGALWIDKQTDTSLAINLGNDIQHYYTIVNLYREMGIADEDIVAVKASERKTLAGQNGEKMIMAINEALFSIGADDLSMPFPFPDHITPVFLGLSFLGRTSIPSQVVEYLRKYEPIGCRDTFTMHLLRNFGIECYTFGCISITLPQRKNFSKANKVYAVNVSDELLDYIPESIKNSSNFIRFSQSFPDELNYSFDHERRYKLAERTLLTYAENARLVVTARLHAVLPCIGMGIPVIFATENHSKRLAWIDKLLPVYTCSRWSQINWDPEPVNVCEIKKLMRDTAKEAIQSAIDGKPRDTENLKKISAFWEDRPKFNYENFVQDVLEREFPNMPNDFQYILWGVGLVGERVYQVMREKYPSAKMALAVDSYVNGVFNGEKIMLPEEILKHEKKMIFVATYTGRQAVEEWMQQHGKKRREDYILFSTVSG